MNSATPAIRELARRLITLEAPHDANSTAGGRDTARACEKLRMPIAKLAGAAGYRSLISRTIAVAKAEFPALDPVQVRMDGSLEGFEEIAQKDVQAGTAVLIQLLSLLVTFIGEPLTRVLIRDAWPDATVEKTDLLQVEEPS